MKVETTSLVIEHDFDTQTLEELQTLRETRLGLAEKQYKDAEQTIDQLISRGLIEKAERASYLEELKEELAKKIKTLSERAYDNNVVYIDEVLLYSDLIVD